MARLDSIEVVRAPDRRRLLRRAGLMVLIGGGVVLLIARMPGLGEVRARFAHADAEWIIIAAGLEIGSIAGFVVALQRALSRRISWRASLSIGTTAQGVNAVVPAGGTGGLAVAAVLLSNAGLPAGFAASRMVALFLLASVATNVLLIIVAGIGVAAGVLPGNISVALSLVPALTALTLVAIAVVVVKRLKERPASATGPGANAVQRATRSLLAGVAWSWELLRGGDPLLIVGALAYILCDLGALAGALVAVGSGGPSLAAVALAYTLGQVGSLISLPGTIEGGLIGVLLLYGWRLQVAVPAVLIYRTIAIVVPLSLGIIGASQLRQSLGEVRLRAGEQRWHVQPEASAR